jgi:hypothetical protein
MPRRTIEIELDREPQDPQELARCLSDMIQQYGDNTGDYLEENSIIISDQIVELY